MTSRNKQLSNPFSTGGGGGHFEAHVQASFVALMLTGGYAPSLPCWPIRKIKLQGKIDGFNTDDFIIFVEDEGSNEERKLLGQVKHSVRFTKHNKILADVIHAAWHDYNTPSLFKRHQDKIALITGPLNETDFHNVVWLLDQARHSKESAEFFQNVSQANFSPPKAEEKLDVFRHHLKSANNNSHVGDEELYSFLHDFHLLGYDLGKEVGVVLSLLHSHISQFNPTYPEALWSRIVDIVQIWNHDAGTITFDKLPEDLRTAFKHKGAVSIPTEFVVPEAPSPGNYWNRHSSATVLAMASLIGKWDESNEPDLEIIRRLINGA